MEKIREEMLRAALILVTSTLTYPEEVVQLFPCAVTLQKLPLRLLVCRALEGDIHAIL